MAKLSQLALQQLDGRWTALLPAMVASGKGKCVTCLDLLQVNSGTLANPALIKVRAFSEGW